MRNILARDWWVLVLLFTLAVIDHEVSVLGRHIERAACLHRHGVRECAQLEANRVR